MTDGTEESTMLFTGQQLPCFAKGGTGADVGAVVLCWSRLEGQIGSEVPIHCPVAGA